MILVYLGGTTIMVTIKEMCVVENVAKAGYNIGCVQTIPPKILGWISDNTICTNGRNMPMSSASSMLIATVIPIIAGYDITKIDGEKHEITVLVPSLAVKMDDGTWNLYSNVVITLEVKYDKNKDKYTNVDVITQTFNMKMMTKSTDIMTGLDLFDLFSAFDGRVM